MSFLVPSAWNIIRGEHTTVYNNTVKQSLSATGSPGHAAQTHTKTAAEESLELWTEEEGSKVSFCSLSTNNQLYACAPVTFTVTWKSGLQRILVRYNPTLSWKSQAGVAKACI